MSNITFLPPPAVRELLQPPGLRRRLRRIDHWRTQAADRLAEIGGAVEDFDALDEIAERLRRRAEADYPPPAA